MAAVGAGGGVGPSGGGRSAGVWGRGDVGASVGEAAPEVAPQRPPGSTPRPKRPRHLRGGEGANGTTSEARTGVPRGIRIEWRVRRSVGRDDERFPTVDERRSPGPSSLSRISWRKVRS